MKFRSYLNIGLELLLCTLWVTTLQLVGAVLRFIGTEWNNVKKPRVFLHNDGFFLILFDSMNDRNEILYGGPVVNGWVVLLR